MSHPFVHVELRTRDLERAKRFYRELLDWKLEDLPMGYTAIRVGEGTGGGMMPHPDPEAPSQWLAYVAVGDVDEVAARARSLGARIAQPRTEVPGAGWFAVLVDPTGAALGLWQPRTGE